MKEWKLKKQDAKAKKELDEKEGNDKATGDKKSDKPKELDSPLMNQAEVEATMAEYEVTTVSFSRPFKLLVSLVISFCLHCKQMHSHQSARNIGKVKSTSGQVVHTDGAYPSFRSMERVGASLLPPGWDVGPSQGYPPAWNSLVPIYTPR